MRKATVAATCGAPRRSRWKAIQASRRRLEEVGCAEFGFFQALGDAQAFLLIEDCADQAALGQHMAAAHTQAFFARDLVAGITPIEKSWMS